MTILMSMPPPHPKLAVARCRGHMVVTGGIRPDMARDVEFSRRYIKSDYARAPANQGLDLTMARSPMGERDRGQKNGRMGGRGRERRCRPGHHCRSSIFAGCWPVGPKSRIAEPRRRQMWEQRRKDREKVRGGELVSGGCSGVATAGQGSSGRRGEGDAEVAA